MLKTCQINIHCHSEVVTLDEKHLGPFHTKDSQCKLRRTTTEHVDCLGQVSNARSDDGKEHVGFFWINLQTSRSEGDDPRDSRVGEISVLLSHLQTCALAL